MPNGSLIGLIRSNESELSTPSINLHIHPSFGNFVQLDHSLLKLYETSYLLPFIMPIGSYTGTSGSVLRWRDMARVQSTYVNVGSTKRLLVKV
jgi:hypothetical protein